MEKFFFVRGELSENERSNITKLMKRREDEEIVVKTGDAWTIIVAKSSFGKFRHFATEDHEYLIIGDLKKPNNDDDINTLVAEQDETRLIYDGVEGNALIIGIENATKIVSIIIEPWFRRMVYYSEGAKRDYISSEMKTILLLEPDFRKRINHTAIHCYIALYQVFGYATLFDNIKVFTSGTINKLDQSWIAISRYDYPVDYNHELNMELHTKSVAEKFVDTVKELMQKDFKSLFMSGGLDSRMVLAAFPPENRGEITALNLGNDYCTETRLAQLAADTIGVPLTVFKTKPEHIIENAELNAFSSEGGLFLGTAVTIEAARLFPTKSVDGNPGDLHFGGTWANKLLTYPVDPSNKYYDEGLILGEPIVESSIKNDTLRVLFGPELDEIKYQLYKLVQSDFDFLDFVKDRTLKTEYYALQNRVKRQTQHSIEEIQELEHPFMEDELMILSLTTPIAHRSARKFQVALLKEIEPKLDEVPSTSIRGVEKKSSFKTRVTGFLKRVGKNIPVLSSIGKRMIYSNMAKKREDTYLPMNEWFRDNQEFNQFVTQKLDDFRDRKLVNSEGIDLLVNETLNSERNHMDMLSRLVNLEILLQQFSDGKAFQTYET